MTNIYILKINKVEQFLKKYVAIPTLKQIREHDESFRYSIDWNKFILENPLYTGIYVDFDPKKYISSNKNTKELTYDVIFIGSWLISSMCIWDKSAIIKFQYMKEMNLNTLSK